MCRYNFSPYRPIFVCTECRIGWKGPHECRPLEPGSIHCGRCGKPGINMGRDFHVPRSNRKNQWRKIELMIEQGYNWQTCGCKGPGPRPKTLAQAKQGKMEDSYNRVIRKSPFRPGDGKLRDKEPKRGRLAK